MVPYDGEVLAGEGMKSPPKKFRIDLTTEGKSLDSARPEDVIAEEDDVLVGGSAPANPAPPSPK
eukprot:6939352-Alexandrium_andersonii.AAC.1